MKLIKFFFFLSAFGTSALFIGTHASEKLCGKTASLIVKANSQMEFTIPEKFKIDDDYCDVPNGEKHANYIFRLLDATKRVIYEKKFILEEFSHFEEISTKVEGKIANNKIEKKGSQRILKIPYNENILKAETFSITNINDQSKTSQGAFKW